MQIPDYRNKKDWQSVSVPVVTPKDKDQSVDFRQDDGLWMKTTDNYIETGQRKDFNDYELVKDEYMKSLTVTDNLERRYLQDISNPQNDRATQSGKKRHNGR